MNKLIEIDLTDQISQQTTKFWPIYSEFDEKYSSVPFHGYNKDVSDAAESLMDSMQDIIHRIELLLHIGPNMGRIINHEKVAEGLDAKKKFESARRSHREMKAFYQQSQIKESVEEIKKVTAKANEATNEIKEVKNNLFGFFGIIVGILAFVFTNINLLQLASTLTYDKVIIIIGLVNLCLGLGIYIQLFILSKILSPSNFNNNIEWTKLYIFWGVAMSLIIGVGIFIGNNSFLIIIK